MNYRCPPQVAETLADTNFTRSLMSSDFPVSLLCVLQSGTTYQLLSREPSFWTCAPTSGGSTQDFSGQQSGSDWPLNLLQWVNQLPQLQVRSLVPLILLTHIVLCPFTCLFTIIAQLSLPSFHMDACRASWQESDPS